MAYPFGSLVFTPVVKSLQERYGSRRQYARRESSSFQADPIGAPEAEFLSECDSFYMATVGEGGWPYVQHRGGPPGFLKVLDDKTLAFADFRGNRQYITVGNANANDRAALFHHARQAPDQFGGLDAGTVGGEEATAGARHHDSMADVVGRQLDEVVGAQPPVPGARGFGPQTLQLGWAGGYGQGSAFVDVRVDPFGRAHLDHLVHRLLEVALQGDHPGPALPPTRQAREKGNRDEYIETVAASRHTSLRHPQ